MALTLYVEEALLEQVDLIAELSVETLNLANILI